MIVGHNLLDAWEELKSLMLAYELCCNEHNTEENDNLYYVSGGSVSGGCNNA